MIFVKFHQSVRKTERKCSSHKLVKSPWECSEYQEKCVFWLCFTVSVLLIAYRTIDESVSTLFSSISNGYVELQSEGYILSKHAIQSVSFALPTIESKTLCYIAKDQVKGTIGKDRAVFFVKEGSDTTTEIITQM